MLHSGGMDSTVCLLMASKTNRRVVSLGIDYGQRHAIEHLYAKAICQEYGIERHELKVEWTKPVREIPMNRSLSEMSAKPSIAFLPGRNLLFLSIAVSHAVGIGAEEVWIGVNSVDFSGYPDCTSEFLNSFRNTIILGIPDGPQIVAPLQTWTKIDIAKEAKKFGLSKFSTWSCYRPKIVGSGISPCGHCDACILHEHAWKDL